MSAYGSERQRRREGGARDYEGFECVVGLEVHCELLTATKLFCGCKNAFGDEPNTNTCPVCLGLPGSLPVLNGHAVELAMRIGLALNCTVQPSIFHRKNYFYPDMPKDYQISQYDIPINTDGYLDLPSGARVGIVRAHIEEDTGKTTHSGGGGRIHDAMYSLVDYNRAGVPLVEIVSEPDIRSGEQAREYVSELRAVLVAVGASDGRMEEGSLRVDANVSVRRPGEPFGTRCEIKNLNSLRSLGRAVDYETRRQVDLLVSGGAVAQETRHWDEQAGHTVVMRSKEEAEDYRYFPEPDLVPLAPDAAWQERISRAMAPLPAGRRRALLDSVGAEGPAMVERVATVVAQDLDGYVMAAVDAGAPGALALSRAANELAAACAEDASLLDALEPGHFASLVAMEARGDLTATQAKAVLAEMLTSGEPPEAIASRKGFEALDPGSLRRAVEEVVAANSAEWERYKEGEAKMAQFFVGQVMKATRQKADGKAVMALLADLLRGSAGAP